MKKESNSKLRIRIKNLEKKIKKFDGILSAMKQEVFTFRLIISSPPMMTFQCHNKSLGKREPYSFANIVPRLNMLNLISIFEKLDANVISFSKGTANFIQIVQNFCPLFGDVHSLDEFSMTH